MLVSLIPDAVICITNNKTGKKMLLFMELDRGGMSLNCLKEKILRYVEYFRNNGYKEYNYKFNYSFQGYRVIFIFCTRRVENVLKIAVGLNAVDFVWGTDIAEIQSRVKKGILTDKIWSVAGSDAGTKYSLV